MQFLYIYFKFCIVSSMTIYFKFEKKLFLIKKYIFENMIFAYATSFYTLLYTHVVGLLTIKDFFDD